MYEAVTIRVDLDSAAPVYRQIVDQLRTLIVEQQLKPGETLPSVRRLSIDLGIHFNTVAEAYRSLAEEGWITVSHGRAARVLERSSAIKADRQVAESFHQRLRHMIAEMRAQGMAPALIRQELRELAERIGE